MLVEIDAEVVLEEPFQVDGETLCVGFGEETGPTEFVEDDGFNLGGLVPKTPVTDRSAVFPHFLRTVEDYFYEDWDGSLRWPVGWPCKGVYAPPVEACPVLRTQVEFVFNEKAFRPYVARFQKGPLRLEPRMAARLQELFAGFQRIG